MTKTHYSAKTPDLSAGESGAGEPVVLNEYKQRHESLIEAAMKTVGMGRAVEQNPDQEQATAQKQQMAEAKDEGHPLQDFRLEPERHMPLSLAVFRPLATAAKHYEALRANIWTRYSQGAMKVILFVGATAGSGTTTAAANFASTMAADANTKVLLIDANLREPSDARQPAVEPEQQNSVDLVRLLTDNKSPFYPVPGPSNLYVLPSGMDSKTPISLFQSEAFDRFLNTARSRFEYVIIDAPPLQGHPESLILSRKADGIVLLVESEKTRKRTALWAKEQIELAGGKLLGVVLNKRKYYIPDWLYKRM